MVEGMGSKFQKEMGKPYNIFEFARSIGKDSNLPEFKLLTKNSFRSLIERAAKSDA